LPNIEAVEQEFWSSRRLLAQFWRRRSGLPPFTPEWRQFLRVAQDRGRSSKRRYREARSREAVIPMEVGLWRKDLKTNVPIVSEVETP